MAQKGSITRRFGRPVTIAMSLAVLAGGFWAFFELSAWATRGGEQSPLYSARRHDPYGTAALFELLAQRGADVGTLERAHPPAGFEGVIVQVLGAAPDENDLFGPPPELHPERVKQWMSRGNTVVQFTAHHTKLMETCEVPVATGPTVGPTWKIIERHMIEGRPPEELPGSAFPATWTAGAVSWQGVAGASPVLRAPIPLARESDAGWLPLAVTRPGEMVVIGMRPVGRGRLIVVASPTPVLNGFLDLGDNLAMVLAMVGNGPVLIDEWSHGIGRPESISAMVRRVGLMPALFQVVVVLLLYVWSTMGHRRVDVAEVDRRRSSAEQIVTLGHLYGQVMPPDELATRGRAEVRRRIASVLGCPPAEIEAKASSETGLRDRVAALLASVPAVGPLRTAACPQCDYDLRGTTATQCPECGAVIGPEMRRTLDALGRAGAIETDGAAESPHRKSAEEKTAEVLRSSHELVRELTDARSQRFRSRSASGATVSAARTGR